MMQAVSSIYDKVAWRVRFLGGELPPGLDGRTGARAPFTFRQRCGMLNPMRGSFDASSMIAHTHGTDAEGRAYYDIGGRRLYYQPDWEDVDQERLRWGVELILREAFLHEENFGGRVDLSPGDVALDLGGNIGTSALEFADRVGPRGHVYSFEPVTPELIERNVRVNGVDNVTVVAAGVSDQECDCPMRVGDALIDASMARQPSGPLRTIEARMTTLDAFVEKEGLQRVDFVKMDIEGAEELALRGARKTIERFRPKWNIASYHADHLNERQHPKLVELMKEYGYQVEERDEMRIFAW